VMMEGLPIRSLKSVDNHALTPARTKSPLRSNSSSVSSCFSNSAKKKAKIVADERSFGEALRLTVPSPSEFGVKTWSVSIDDKPDFASRDSSAELSTTRPPLSKSSSDATTGPAWSSAVTSADGEDCDYSYFVEGKEVEYVDCMEYSPQELSGGNISDPLMLTSDFLFDVPVPEAVPLSRVVSFSGFESTLMYTNQSMRNMGNLRLERRRALANSKEFKLLRHDFAEKQVRTIVQRTAAHKKSGIL
jgi:hypothetical protein